MFGVPIEGMPAAVRRQAKAINFGVIYGISAFGLANNLRIPREEAKRFIDTYFVRFPGIREYMDRTVAFAKEHGHVETLFGRRIHTPEINARGPHAAVRQPGGDQRADPGVGGGHHPAGDDPGAGRRSRACRRGCCCRCMTSCCSRSPRGRWRRRWRVVRGVMEGAAMPAVALDVPLVVDAGRGPTWAAAH